MTTQTTIDKPAGTHPSSDETIGDMVRDAVAVTRDAAEEVAERAPEVAASAVAEARRQLRAGSDETLAAGATISLGVATGLLLAGVNRMVVGAFLVPAIVMGVTVYQRGQAGRRPTLRAS